MLHNVIGTHQGKLPISTCTVCTAIPAIVATFENTQSSATVAEVATIAVAALTDNMTINVSEPDSPPPIPKGRGIWKRVNIVGERAGTTTERTTCYCCNGTDYWLAGTEQYPHWVCRRCHPPAPRAERKPPNTPVTTAIGE